MVLLELRIEKVGQSHTVAHIFKLLKKYIEKQ